MLPEVYVIVMSDNEISQYYKNRIWDSWVKGGFEVKEFEACVPSTVGKEYCGIELNFDHEKRKERRRSFTPTEIAIWYSHLGTWNLCRKLNKPIIVAEHDVLLCHPPTQEQLEQTKKVWGLCSIPAALPCANFCTCEDCMNIKYQRRHSAGGAYYITPDGARSLINFSMEDRITHNSDWALYKTMSETSNVHEWWRSYQLVSSSQKTTIDHGDNFGDKAIQKYYG